MKKLMLPLLLTFSLTNSSCIGSFKLFNYLKSWNQNATENKYVNGLLSIALWIVPVYPLAIAADAIVINSIEFWSGKNPVAMNANEREIKIVSNGENKYQITATKNNFNVLSLDGKNTGKSIDIRYDEQKKTWLLVKQNGIKIPLASYKDGFYFVHTPNGVKKLENAEKWAFIKATKQARNYN